jgi:hypothetical protein
MARYLSALELTARVHLGKEVEQWLGYADEADYTVLKWLYMAKIDQQHYTLSYIESLDEGDEEWHDIAAFSLLDPDEEVTDSFASVKDAVAFAVQTYGASADRFVPGGMLPVEYASYWRDRNP